MPLLKWSVLSVPLCLNLVVLVPCSQGADAGDLVPLKLKLPAAAFKGTPKDIQLSSFVEPLPDKPRPPMMVPAGLATDANSKQSSTAQVTMAFFEGARP